MLVTSAPQFVRRYKPDNGGTDFLGIRQVNVDMMDASLPGINNVCRFLRPFALISWIFWKFYALAESSGIDEPTEKQMREWQEKVETLFTWGHLEIGSVPGTMAVRPNVKNVPLDFKSWQRVRSSTSLLAAIQYGPPAKLGNGLGLIAPTKSRSIFHTVGLGVRLAEALEEEINKSGSRSLLQELGPSTATAEDAKSLLPCWSIRTPSAGERRVFQGALYDGSDFDSDERIARRSATLRLAMSALRASRKQLTTSQLRQAIFHQQFTASDRHGAGLERAWHRWVTLQVRQAQRLAMESLLAWLEQRVILHGDRSTEPMVSAMEQEMGRHPELLPKASTVSDIRNQLFSSVGTFESLLEISTMKSDWNLFTMMDTLQTELEMESDLSPLYALRLLFFCAAYATFLSEMPHLRQLLRNGGSERLSLRHWLECLDIAASSKPAEFMVLVLESYIVSQHLSVAARRFDGGTQRLRICLEEDGLYALVRKPLRPGVTPDRLSVALSLMADCHMVQKKTDFAGQHFWSATTVQ